MSAASLGSVMSAASYGGRMQAESRTDDGSRRALVQAVAIGAVGRGVARALLAGRHIDS